MVDTIREGKAPLVIRRKGAEGELPVSLEEKIEILTVLARDAEDDIRNRAVDKLFGWKREELQQVLSSPNAHPAVLDFAVNYLAPGSEDLLQALLRNPGLPRDLRDEIQSHLLQAAQEGQAVKPSAPGPLEGENLETSPEDDVAREGERETLIQKINRLSAVEKIKLAITGNQEARMILVRDGNKIVARAVLQSPKLSETEISAYASAKNVSEEVLRLIAGNRAFMKTYSVVKALINNPRAPIDVTLPLLNRINERDLKELGMNRNVPDVIRSSAVKMMKQREEAKKPKFHAGKH